MLPVRDISVIVATPTVGFYRFASLQKASAMAVTLTLKVLPAVDAS